MALMIKAIQDHQVFPVVIHDNHLIADINGVKAVLDTGAPTTVSKSGREFDFLGERVVPQTNYLGVNIDRLNEFVGYEFDVLLGLDCLAKCYWRVESLNTDCPRLVASRSPQLISLSSHVDIVPNQIFDSVPVHDVTVEGMPYRAVFDTGAKLGYLDSEIAQLIGSAGRESGEKVRDFWPLSGFFETDVFDVSVSVAGNDVRLPFGELPDEFGITWAALGANVILGVDAMRQLSVEFALPDGRIYFGPGGGLRGVSRDLAAGMRLGHRGGTQ
jgi:hypothetical protein